MHNVGREINKNELKKKPSKFTKKQSFANTLFSRSCCSFTNLLYSTKENGLNYPYVSHNTIIQIESWIIFLREISLYLHVSNKTDKIFKTHLSINFWHKTRKGIALWKNVLNENNKV